MSNQKVADYIHSAAKNPVKNGVSKAAYLVRREVNNSHYTKRIEDGAQTAELSLLPNSKYLSKTGDDISTDLHKSIIEETPGALKKFLRGDIQTIAANFSNQIDPNKSTPMMLLARTLKSGTLIKLLNRAIAESKAGNFNIANLNLHLNDEEGRTLFHYAYILGQKSKTPEKDLVLKLHEIDALLPEGKKIAGIKDKEGRTPLQLALSMTEELVREVLIDYEMHPDRSVGADFNSLQCHAIHAIQAVTP